MIKLPRRRVSFRVIPEAQAVRVLGRASRKTLPTKFAVVSWNMFKAKKRGFLEDIAQLAAEADFMLLQEAVLHNDVAHAFHTDSGFEWVMGQSFAFPTKPITSGVKTGSRIAARKRNMVRSRDREPLVNLPKTILATEYDIAHAGGPLLVINIHAVNLVRSGAFRRQVEQVEDLIGAHKGPVIVGGDFNTWNPRRRAILARAMTRVDLAYVPLKAARWRHFKQVLDHIFYRGLVLRSAAALLHIKSSDHIPLRVEFELPSG
jgi:endonuclease/exonuclease/phosphatase (EEP) superfamily protein YafD